MPKITHVNRLQISRGYDRKWRVRSPDSPPEVLIEKDTFEEAYNWAHKCRKYTHKEPRWTQDELDYLADNYGRLSADDIARHLGRSVNSLKIISFRKLGVNQKSNFYTSRSVAKELGIGCAKTVVAWYDRGYLKGKRAPLYNGKNLVWFFEYEDIIQCLTERPWLCNLKKMPQSYFRSIVREQFDKNPWYTTKEAASFLGLASIGPINRYVKEGWLPAVRRLGAGGLGQWIFRHSDLSNFQVNDPRPAHRKSATVADALDHQMKVALNKAFAAAARGHWYQFGHWASVWTTVNMMNKREPSPFKELENIAKEKVKSK